ncbi:nuclear transport factor 2 family protein [Streptomyces flaveolus]|uniref:nuclear transport factor 2 family protein n=1 Tax=Streptomyces flaveolus TaxID=67297 RepID=UPI00342420B6
MGGDGGGHDRVRDGAFISWHLDEYYALFQCRPAPDEPTRTCRIDTIDVHGTVATATMTLSRGADTFTDIFLPNRSDGSRRIANNARRTEFEASCRRTSAHS